MTRKTAAALALFLCALTSVSRAALEFRGYVIMGAEQRFSLKDTADQATSPWITIGKVFHAYTLVSYDAAKEILTVKTPEGAIKQLSLESASIDPLKDTRLRISGTITFGKDEAAQATKATLIMGEETVFELKDGMSLRLKPSPFQEGIIRYDAVFDKLQDDGTRKKLSSPAILARPGQEFTIQTGD